MPRLPSAEQLATRIPQNQGGIVSPSKGAFDISGVAQLGQVVEGFGASIKDRQDAMNLHKAKTFWSKAKLQADNAFDQDNDFETYAQRYNEVLDKAEQQAGEMISNLRMKEIFKNDISLSRAQGIEQIKDFAFTKEREAGLATLQGVLDDSREIALNAQTNTDRQGAFDTMNDAISTAELVGYLDKDDAQVMRKQVGVDAAIGTISVQDLKTQKKLLNNNEGPAKLIPTDQRKTMLENVNTRLVNQEGFEKANDIRIEGGDRTQRLDKARKIKDPDIRKAAISQVEHDLAQEKLARAELQYNNYQDLAKKVIAGESPQALILGNPEAWDTLTAEQQAGILSAKGAKTDIGVYDKLNRLAMKDKDEAYLYFQQNAHKLDQADREKWSDRLAKPDELKGFLTQSQKLQVKLKEAGISKDSKLKYEAMEAIQEDVIRFHESHGRKPDAKEEEAIINSVFDKVVDTVWFNPFTTDVYGFDLTPEERLQRIQDKKAQKFNAILDQYKAQMQEGTDIPALLSDEEISIIYRNAERMGLLDE